MTYSEAIACKARGMSRESIVAQIVAAQAAELHATAAVLDRAYAPRPVPRPAYASEMISRPRFADEYNGRSTDYLLNA